MLTQLWRKGQQELPMTRPPLLLQAWLPVASASAESLLRTCCGVAFSCRTFLSLSKASGWLQAAPPDLASKVSSLTVPKTFLCVGPWAWPGPAPRRAPRGAPGRGRLCL